MKEEIFRKRSLEKISSPEKIDDYIKTESLNLRLVIIAVAIVFLGFVLWSVLGKIQISETAVTVCKNGRAVCYINENNSEDISEKTEFNIEDENYYMKSITKIPCKVSDALSEYEAHVVDFDENAWVYAVELEPKPEDGIYKTKVILNSVSPISLLLN